MKILKFLILVLFTLNISNVFATKSDIKRLDTFTKYLKSLSSDFTQTLQNEMGEITEVSSGKVWLKRPLEFRWDYYYPYEQKIIGDSQSLWIYDIDLDQVIIKSLDHALGSAPISILSENKPLDDDFYVMVLEMMDGMDWFRLVPKKEDSDFKEIYLGFGMHSLEIMELHDQFNQISRIVFDNLAVNPSLDKKLFQFSPPSYVDIIDER